MKLMKSNKENLLLAKEILLGGRPIIFPTDTVYGIGAIPTKKAVDEIYRLKKRDKSKKIIALVSSIDKIYDIAEDIDENIINNFMPGALTVIFRAKPKMYDIVGETIGVRIPDSKLTLELIESVGGILMTSSANISGNPPAKTVSELSKDLVENVECILTSDQILTGIPSTIISYIDKKYTLIREGEIPFEKIINLGGYIFEGEND